MKKIFYFILLITFFSCCQKKEAAFYNLVNEKFISLVDTVPAYDYHAFFLSPSSDTIKPDKKSFADYKILVDTKFLDPKEFKKALITELGDNAKYSEYKKLLALNPLKIDSLNLRKLTQVGKFELLDLAKNKIDLYSDYSDNFVGTIQFYQPFIDNNHAIIMVVKGSSPKAGIENAFLFEKENNNWILKKNNNFRKMVK